MKKQLLVISFLAALSMVLSACSDSGTDATGADTNSGRTNYSPADFTVKQLSTLSQNNDAQLLVELNNLATDDAIYITVNSDDVENAKLMLSPSKTILNPNKGTASFVVTAKDLGVTSAPNISLLVTTSGNNNMEQDTAIEWSAL